MAEFQEVMKQKNRMCKTFTPNCSKCPISSTNNSTGDPCDEFMGECPNEAEELIMDWAKEHPVITNADKFKEVFGMDVVTGIIGITWNREYKEPKEKV